jgi:hypothetical protein
MFKNKISDLIKIFFIFICLLYGWIPFEAETYAMSFRIHLIFMFLLMLYAFYSNSFKISKYSILFFFTLIFISGLLFFKSYGSAIFSFVTSILFASIVVPTLFNNSKFKNYFTQALYLLIIMSISMFFLQIIIYISTGNLPLLHELIFPFSKARIATEIQFDNLTRMGGMYIEPGTYSNYMFILLTIYFILKKKVNYYLLFICALSIILTYSLWGMIFATYLLIIIFLVQLKRISFHKKILLLFIVFSVLFYINQNIQHNNAIQYGIEKLQRNGTNNSTGAKKTAYKEFINSIENYFILGDGFSPKLQKKVLSLQDAGLILNLSIVFGIIFTICFLLIYLILVFKLTNITIAFISLPIFMSKLFYWDPAIWLLFFMLIYEYIYTCNVQTKKGINI